MKCKRWGSIGILPYSHFTHIRNPPAFERQPQSLLLGRNKLKNLLLATRAYGLNTLEEELGAEVRMTNREP